MTNAERDRCRTPMARQYRAGATVRQVADAFEKSYGFTYDRLREARVTMRRRGRPTPL